MAVVAVSGLTQHVVNAYQRKQGDAVPATKGLPERWRAPFINVSGQKRSTAFKKRPAFGFTLIIST